MKLSAPLRVCWDWNWPLPVRRGSPAGNADGDRVRLIAAELAKARILLLEVGYPSLSDITGGVLRAAVEKVPAQTSLVLDPQVASRLGAAELRQETGAGEIWIDGTPPDAAAGEKAAVPRARDGSVWPELRVYLTAANGAAAADLITGAAEAGVRKISLPIIPLFGRFLGSAWKCLPSWKELMNLADALEPLLLRFPDIDLRVHYQALWTILRARGLAATPGEAPGHSGCQAAGALAYVDPAGVLYPCAALPLPVGRIGESPIDRIWGNEEVRALRHAIEKVPLACEDCGEWTDCRGGCRGWAHFLAANWGEPGPDCGRLACGPGPGS